MLASKSISLNSNSFKKNQVGEQKWLIRFDTIIKENLSSSKLDNKKIATSLFMSERQLYRKVKELTNLSPQKYLLISRLEQAMIYLKNGKFRTVKETAFAVGYTKTAWFTKIFKKEYGNKPLQILRENGWR